jgi:hypothetical protein
MSELGVQTEVLFSCLQESMVFQFHSIWCNFVSRCMLGEEYHYSQRSRSHLPCPCYPCSSPLSPLAWQRT